jgi:hypothetical protein
MKKLLTTGIILFSHCFHFGDGAQTAAPAVKQSAQQHLSEFASELSDTIALSKLLQGSTTEKLEEAYIEGDEHTTIRGGRAFVTRSFDVELVARGDALLERLKDEIERRIKNSGLEIEQGHSYPTGMSVHYVGACVVGAVHVRAVQDSGQMLKSTGKTFHLFFIFEESYCKQ